MAGFSQDLPTSPQSILQRLNTTSTNSSTSSSSEIDMMRNRVLQMQALAITEKEVS
jgi:phage shock protein A